jgi:NAD(P)-dependent dehydrogenase (short-subunit alcohol dehydrogenase family)
MTKNHWTVKDIPSLAGKTAVVTGANSGLGYHASLELARKGALVILACRSIAKGETARNQILTAAPDASLAILPLNLASLASIRDFVETFQNKYAKLDILINNAGVMGVPQTKTIDGFELQFGTNHLGHFALTGQLINMLIQTPGSRVVNVSSLYHKSGTINFKDLMGEIHYDPWRAYAQSKLANLLFTYELQRKLEQIGSACMSLAAHPGYSSTHLQFVGPEMNRSQLQYWMMKVGNKLLAQSAAQGALPELYAATAPGVKGGMYIGPDGMNEVRGYPTVVKSIPASLDLAAAKRLWAESEALTGITFDLQSP